MATIKVVLRKKIRKDGTFPLALSIVKDRKPTYIHIGKNILETDWDAIRQKVKKSHLNATFLNNYIRMRLADATDRLLEMELRKEEFSAVNLKNQSDASTNLKFLNQSALYLSNLRDSGKFNRLSAEAPRINRFKEFLGGKDIPFQDITVPLLVKYQAYLKGTRSISKRTIINHLVVIRSIYNQAIKGKIVDPKYYPFGKDGVPIKFPDSIKIGLSVEEVKRLEDMVVYKESKLNHYRNLWLLSFYFAGMRVSDLLRLKWSDFQNDRLYYSMGKNEKAGSFKLGDKAIQILAQYEHRRNLIYVFPEGDRFEEVGGLFELQKKISYAVKSINEGLVKVAEFSGIQKKLTMHIARHTFGNISGDKIPIQMLQKLYRHTSITTTIAYQSNFIHKDTDEALDSVVNF